MGGEYDRVWAEIRRELKATMEWTDVGALTGAGAIMEEVVRQIARTDVVIVDVSEARPNVFYELGIAHVMKGVNKVVLVKQSSSNVPFDVQPYRHLDYEPTPEASPRCCRNSSAGFGRRSSLRRGSESRRVARTAPTRCWRLRNSTRSNCRPGAGSCWRSVT